MRLRVLDCTLRDGGYCNDWNFGNKNIKKITKGLVDAAVDIIECGFLTQKEIYNKSKSKFNTFSQVADIIPQKRSAKMFVCMMNYGEFNIDDIPQCTSDSVDGIRVAFHKKDMLQALEFCRQIGAKGYKVFVQPMVSLSYSDSEFLELIQLSNKIEPYAFYIVDSFGVMKQKDLIRMFYLVEHNLCSKIKIGFHSHNNMQLAYSNAQALSDIKTNREIIIDCSIYGMGRGAGNLNTELFIMYLNENKNAQYDLKPLLNIIDEILSYFYQQNYWGYSLSNYISAKYNTHPNYASYLDAKKTLTVEIMDEIFAVMDDEKRLAYDQNYIENLYVDFMAKKQIQAERFVDLKEKLRNKEVLVVAPGCSSIEEKDRIVAVAKRPGVVSISVNHDYPEYQTDFIFVSNLRRFRELDEQKREKCIVTSNISRTDVYYQTGYSDLLNEVEFIKDNSGMMLIKMLIDLGVSKVMLAGMDGYSVEIDKNFADENMAFYAEKTRLQAMNVGMCTVLNKYSKEIDIEWVTTPRYISI